MSKDLRVPATLPSSNNLRTSWIGGWLDPRVGPDAVRMEKSYSDRESMPNLRSILNPSHDDGLATTSNTGVFKIGSRRRIPQIGWNRVVNVYESGRSNTHPPPPTHPFTHTHFFFLWRCDPTRVIASLFLMFLDHTPRRTTVGRTTLDE
jgi:hypothetical protein